MRTKTSAIAAATLALGLVPAAADAKWMKVTDDGSNQVEVGLARTADGTLHVLWPRDRSLAHSALSRDGRHLSAPTTVVTYGSTVHTSPALLASGGSLRALFSGLGGSFDEVLASATSADGGATWSAPQAVSHGPAHASIGLSAAALRDGTPVTVWGSPGSGFHLGLSPAAADGAFPGGALSDPGVGVDAATGAAVAAWNRVDEDGVAAMALPSGSPVVLPNSDAAQLQHTVAVTGRIGAPGVYIGYTVGTNQFTGRPAVIRFGSSRPVMLSKTRGARHISLVAGPSGRLWAFWDRAGRVYARRSNRAVSAWGATVAAKAVGDTIYDLAGEGSIGPLDLFARTQRGGIADYHLRLRPGLTLKARPGKHHKVRFTVLDAGEPVKGATVRVKGAPAHKTGANGTTTYTLPPGARKAKASKTGYVSARARVRVR